MFEYISIPPLSKDFNLEILYVRAGSCRGGGVGLIPIPPLTPVHFMSSTPDSNRTTNLSTSTISPPARANGTSTGELGWTGHPHSALPSPGEPWAAAYLPSALDWAGQ